MERTPSLDTLNKVGQEVRLKGWVRLVRDHGKVMFVDIRDYSGVVQVVFVAGMLSDEQVALIKGLHGEDVVEIIGTAQQRKPGTENADMPTGTVEVFGKELTVLQKAAELPFDMGGKDLNLELPTLYLFYRARDIRWHHYPVLDVLRLLHSANYFSALYFVPLLRSRNEFPLLFARETICGHTTFDKVPHFVF